MVGDGGKGGSVVGEEVTEGLNTLIDFRYQQHFFAKNGQSGMGRQRTGKDGDDILLRVPVGTEILDEDQETVLADLTVPGERVLLGQGWQWRFRQPALSNPPPTRRPAVPIRDRKVWNAPSGCGSS